MLVRARGTAQRIERRSQWEGPSYKLLLELPAIYLECSNYDISVRMIFFDCRFTDGRPTSQMWSLQTTAVDKCAVNPMQEIISFTSNHNTPGSDYTFVYYEPSIARNYKIQLTQFNTAEFILTALKPDDSITLQDIEILFEISKHDRF